MSNKIDFTATKEFYKDSLDSAVKDVHNKLNNIIKYAEHSKKDLRKIKKLSDEVHELRLLEKKHKSLEDEYREILNIDKVFSEHYLEIEKDSLYFLKTTFKTLDALNYAISIDNGKYSTEPSEFDIELRNVLKEYERHLENKGVSVVELRSQMSDKMMVSQIYLNEYFNNIEFNSENIIEAFKIIKNVKTQLENETTIFQILQDAYLNDVVSNFYALACSTESKIEWEAFKSKISIT